MKHSLRSQIKRYLSDFRLFTSQSLGFRLRSYQLEAAQAVLDAIQRARADALVMMFPRQSGKNTLQAQLEACLLWRYQWKSVEMVKISPTWKPQSINAMQRLENVLQSNRLTRHAWRKEAGYIYTLGKARLSFFSGSAHTNIVGATASLLLQLDEAQDILPEKYDKDIAPMAAATSAPVVFWGTAWTSDTLLARELSAAKRLEKEDGNKRAFVLCAPDVAREVPAYAIFVTRQVERLGRQHPLVRTQFFSEEINEEGKLFTSTRLALLQGTHSPQKLPLPHAIYALLLDVGGADENADSYKYSQNSSQGTSRDSTALTVIEVELPTLQDTLIQRPQYRVVQRYEWVGMNHTQLYTQVKALFEHWQARYCVIDASGLGMGLASFLQTTFIGKIIPFVFTAQSKSRLGWDFIALIESGRFKEYAIEGVDEQSIQIQQRFINQLAHIEHHVKAERGQLLQWGVPAGTRDAQDGSYVHDDLVISTALCTCLDDVHWGQAVSVIIPPIDPFSTLF